MSILTKVKSAAHNVKSFVVDNSQNIYNVAMLVTVAAVLAAIAEKESKTDSEITELQEHDFYIRTRIYDVERAVQMPVHEHDQGRADYLASQETKSPTD